MERETLHKKFWQRQRTVNYEERQTRLVAGILRRRNVPRQIHHIFLLYLTMPESYDPMPKLKRLFDSPESAKRERDPSRQTERVTLDSENRLYDSPERLIFTEYSLLAILKHPLFDRCDRSLYVHVLRMMHRLHSELPAIAAPDTRATDLFPAAHLIRLIVVLQSHPNFVRFLGSTTSMRLQYWNSWIRDIAPQLGKDPRNLIGLRIELVPSHA